ncbi:MAG: hypothetical protein RLZZ502_819 [Pseudomonadota bacterium]
MQNHQPPDHTNPLVRKIPLAIKLFGLLGAVGLLAAGFMAWRLSLQFDRGFDEYLHSMELRRLDDLSTAISDYYAEHRTWEHLDPPSWRRLQHQVNPNVKALEAAGVRVPLPEGPVGGPVVGQAGAPGPLASGRPDGPRKGGGLDPLNFGARCFLLNAQGRSVIGRPPPPAEELRRLGHPQWIKREIQFDGTVVGVLGLMPVRMSPATQGNAKTQPSAHEGDFLRTQHQLVINTVLWMGVGIVLLSAALAWWLARRVKNIQQVALQVAAGNFQARCQAQGHDELSELGRSIDLMASSLAANARAQQRWFGQIAHELRTPLSVLRGEIEAMQDGVRALSQTALNSLAQEVMHLTRLTEDMQLLSNSELGNLRVECQEADIVPVLQQAVERWQERFNAAGLQLIGENTQSLPMTCHFDTTRMRQILDNLLSNSLRYTDAPGVCELGLSQANSHDARVHISIADSAPGVDENDLSNLFQAMYQGHHKRQVKEGSGLGLAVCKALVQAQGGSITASQASQGGLKITVQLS